MYYYIVSSREHITKVELVSWNQDTKTLSWLYDGEVITTTLKDLTTPLNANIIKLYPGKTLYYVSGVFETLAEAKVHAIANLQSEIEVAKPYRDLHSLYVRNSKFTVAAKEVLKKQIKSLKRKLRNLEAEALERSKESYAWAQRRIKDLENRIKVVEKYETD